MDEIKNMNENSAEDNKVKIDFSNIESTESGFASEDRFDITEENAEAPVEAVLENGVYTLTVQFGSGYYGYFSDNSVGDYANLAFSMYVYNGFGLYSCENVYME